MPHEYERGNSKGSMPIHEPRISVVIPLYNHEKYIAEAVYSVLGQSFTDFELIVINDGSSDGSENVIREIKDERIRYFFQDNQGASKAINRGIGLARGEYVSILNSDDVYDPKRLEECLRTLKTDLSLSAVFTHLECIDAKGNFIKHLRGAEENWADHTPETSFKGENNIALDLLAGNFLTTTSNLFCRKTVFDSLGNFSDLRYAHDYDFFLRLCSHHAVHLIEKPLVKYRIHGLNTVKENEAAVQYEVGLVLTDFFLNSDFRRLFGDGDVSTVMTKFFSSVKTGDADKMIMTLFVFGMKYPEIKNGLSDRLRQDTGSPFRKTCMERLSKISKGWILWRETNERLVAREKELSEGWMQWRETNERLVAREKELSEGWMQWRETNERLVARDRELQEAKENLATLNEKVVALTDQLIERDTYIQSIRNSWWFRSGRFLTMPFRRLFHKGFSQKNS